MSEHTQNVLKVVNKNNVVNSCVPEDMFIVDPSGDKAVNAAVLESLVGRARGILNLLELSGEQDEDVFLIPHKGVMKNLYHIDALLQQAEQVLDYAKE